MSDSTAVHDTTSAGAARSTPWGTWAGPAIVALASAPLAFPLQAPVAAVCAAAAVCGYWLWDLRRNGLPAWPRTWLVSMGVFAVMVVVAALRSPYPEVTAPKFCSLLLGLAVMWVIGRGVTSRRALYLAVGGYLILGGILVIAGGLATTWQWKFAGLSTVAHMLPRSVENLPGTDGGVHANSLGAAILLVLPACGVVCWGVIRRGSTGFLGRLGLGRLAAGVVRTACVLAVLALSTILLLTQSRTSWLSLTTAAATLAAVRWRVLRWGLVAFTALVVVGVSVTGPQRMLAGAEGVLRQAGVAGPHFKLDVGERTEVWGYAVEELRRSPVLGIGLGAFRRTVLARRTRTESAGVDIAHAHNVFLQTALDLGVIGLVAYSAVVALSIGMAWRCAQRGGTALKLLAVGLGGNILAVHLFGLVDAVALGAKIGLLMWASIGLLMAMDRLPAAPPPGREERLG